MQVGPGRQFEGFTVSLAIHPHKRPFAFVYDSRDVNEIPARRNIVVCDAAVPAHQYALQNSEGLPQRFQLFEVKRNSEDLSISGVQDVTGGRIARVSPAFHNRFYLPGLYIENSDMGVIEGFGVSGAHSDQDSFASG